jgi:endonuclease/exonuclease/phosphatase family metal-dependent hydrolase
VRTLISWLLVLVAAITGGYLLRAYMGPLSVDFEFGGEEGSSRSLAIDGANSGRDNLIGAKTPDTIRIASFHIDSFGLKKAENRNVSDLVTRIVRDFDIVAIQGIDSKDQTLIPHFASLINADGSQYEYELGPRLGRTTTKEQYAFFFDSRTVEIDRQATYTVADPHDRMHHEPLVALFRARSNDPAGAFTFKLVNVHIDLNDVGEEMNALRDVYRVVSSDVDREDDVILLGDFAIDENDEKRRDGLASIAGMTVAIGGYSNNARPGTSHDNLYFHGRQTREFNGKSGIVDLVRIFNLTTEQLLVISDHLPVWAEFSVFEGGRQRRFATRATDRAGSE